MRTALQSLARAKTFLAMGIVVTLTSTTMLAIVAAEGMARIEIDVSFETPREEIEPGRILGRLLTLAESGGYGYGGAYEPAGYGYQVINWLQNGYGYASFQEGAIEAGRGRTVTIDIDFEDVPVGTYRVMIWYDLNGNGAFDDGLEPVAFAETHEAPHGEATMIAVNLGDVVQARAHLQEATANATGLVLDGSDDPVEGATVTASATADGVDHSLSVLTDANGLYSFDLPTGLWYDLEYAFQAELDGVSSETHTLALDRHATNHVPTLHLDVDGAEPTISITGATAVAVDTDGDPDGKYDVVDVTIDYTITGPISVHFHAQINAGSTMLIVQTEELESLFSDGQRVVRIPATSIATQSLAPDNLIAAALDPSYAVIDSFTASASLGVPSDYQLPDLTIVDVIAAPTDLDGDALYDVVRVTGSLQIARPVSAYFNAQLLTGTTEIAGALEGTAFLDFVAGSDTVVIDVPAGLVEAAGIAPDHVRLTAFDSVGDVLSHLTAGFDGGEIADYAASPLRLAEEHVTLVTTPEDPPVETFTVRIAPDVGVTGEYRFSVYLYGEDYELLGQKDIPTSGGTPPVLAAGGTDHVEASFDGAAMSLLLPGEDWELTRVQVYAYSASYDLLGFVEIDLPDPLARSDFVQGVRPIDLPAANTIDVQVLCGVTRVLCSAPRTGEDSAGWKELALRMNVQVNDPEFYALYGQALNAGLAPLASEWRDHAPFEAGVHPVELVFAGRDIRRMGVDNGLGDVAALDVQALSQTYELIDTLRQNVHVPAGDFADAGVSLTIGDPFVNSEQDLDVPITIAHVGLAGTSYYLYVALTTDEHEWITYAWDPITLSGNPHEVAEHLDGEVIREFMATRGLASESFRVTVYLISQDTWETIIHKDEGPFGPFTIDQFPLAPVALGTPTVDAVDTSDPANGLYDLLRVTQPVTVQPGVEVDVYTGLSVYGPNWEWIGGEWGLTRITTGMTTIPFDATSIKGRAISESNINGPYRVYFVVYGTDFDLLGYRELTTEAYLASEFETGGVRILGVADSAMGTNPPGYNGLAVNFNVAVAPDAAGTLAGYVAVYTQDWGFVGYDYRSSIAVDESTSTIEFVISNTYVRSSGLNGQPRYFLYLWEPTTFETIAFDEGRLSNSYNAADFAIDGLEFRDIGEWGDAPNAPRDALSITAHANVGTAGTYHVYAYVYGHDWSWVTFLHEEVTLAAGNDRTFQLHVPALDMIGSGSPGPYRVYVYAYNSDFTSFAFLPSPYQTATYPTSTWTGVLAPAVIDSVGFGAFPATPIAEVPASIAVTVNTPATYTVSASVLIDGVVLDSFQLTEHFAGGARTIPVGFSGSRMWDNWPEAASGNLVLSVTLYRGASGRAQLLQESSATAPSASSRSDFPQPVRGLTLGTASFAGAQTDADAQFDVLRATIPVEVATPGSYRFDVELFGPSGRRFITATEVTLTLAGGTQSVTADLSGADILSANRNGAYRVRISAFLDDGGTLTRVDRQSTTTPSFNANEFN